MTTRGNTARGVVKEKEQFQGRVRKWIKTWALIGKGTPAVAADSARAQLQLLKWVQTEDKTDDLRGARHPHIKPVRDPKNRPYSSVARQEQWRAAERRQTRAMALAAEEQQLLQEEGTAEEPSATAAATPLPATDEDNEQTMLRAQAPPPVARPEAPSPPAAPPVALPGSTSSLAEAAAAAATTPTQSQAAQQPAGSQHQDMAMEDASTAPEPSVAPGHQEAGSSAGVAGANDGAAEAVAVPAAPPPPGTSSADKQDAAAQGAAVGGEAGREAEASGGQGAQEYVRAADALPATSPMALDG